MYSEIALKIHSYLGIFTQDITIYPQRRATRARRKRKQLFATLATAAEVPTAPCIASTPGIPCTPCTPYTPSELDSTTEYFTFNTSSCEINVAMNAKRRKNVSHNIVCIINSDQ